LILWSFHPFTCQSEHAQPFICCNVHSSIHSISFNHPTTRTLPQLQLYKFPIPSHIHGGYKRASVLKCSLVRIEVLTFRNGQA
jgi:hypothetical protein